MLMKIQRREPSGFPLKTQVSIRQLTIPSLNEKRCCNSQAWPPGGAITPQSAAVSVEGVWTVGSSRTRINLLRTQINL